MTKPKQKRLDGKKKNIHLTKQMEKDLSSFCLNKGIESESELIRIAIAKYIYADYQDETLKLQGIDELRKRNEELRDMMEVLFKYVRLMHINLLVYQPEISGGEMQDAAFKSATLRHDKFFTALQESLKNEPPFFERLLHTFYTGANK